MLFTISDFNSFPYLIYGILQKLQKVSIFLKDKYLRSKQSKPSRCISRPYNVGNKGFEYLKNSPERRG